MVSTSNIQLQAKIDATTLYVHFLNAVNVNVPGIVATITGGDRITGITVSPIPERLRLECRPQRQPHPRGDR